MTTLKAVLEEIKAGTTTFKPASKKEADMRDFQSIAKILNHANNKGLLESYLPSEDNRTGNFWYNEVLVLKGLSYKGEMFLAG